MSKTKIEKNKLNSNELCKVMILLSILLAYILVVIFVANKIEPDNTKNKIVFLGFMFSMYLISLYFNMSRKDKIKKMLKIIIPIGIFLIELLLFKVNVLFIPFLLPVVLLALFMDATNSLLFAAFMGASLCVIGIFDGIMSIIFVFVSVFMIILSKYADTLAKKYMAFSITVFTVLISIYEYQVIFLDKVNYLDIVKALPAILIAIVPLYFKLILINYNNSYLKKKLNELSDNENDLLMKLMEVNSGAYFHSIQVADVAAKVAREMKCNVKLVEVSARFHEIGKIAGKSYIEEGVKLMKKNKFPVEVIKIVREHNSKTNFPKTMESAIVMLTDSIETTIGKMSENSSVDKKKIVSQIIDIRFDNGNLDYAILDALEYKKLRRIFVSMY